MKLDAIKKMLHHRDQRYILKLSVGENGSVSALLAIETANSLTNGWNKVMLKADDVTGDDNGNIIITHETGGATQGFYQIRSPIFRFAPFSPTRTNVMSV